MWERLWERRLELGGNGYKVLVPRAPPEGGAAVAARPCAVVYHEVEGVSSFSFSMGPLARTGLGTRFGGGP